jgi:O-antigen ligase
MTYAAFLWGLVWGGMFSGLYNWKWPEMFRTTLGAIQGLRAMTPILAAYLCLVWILAKRPKYPFVGQPLGSLLGYCLVGLLSSLFLSPQTVGSMYWLGVYVAPVLVAWYCVEKEQALKYLQVLMTVNYAVFFLLTMGLMPEVLRVGWGNLPRFQQYLLPMGLGTIRTNGAGRFALIVIIVSVVRFMVSRSRTRWIWPLFAAPAFFLLIQTQSRTSLLGLAVVSVLLVFLLGVDWRYLFVGPIAAVGVFISGFQWRSAGQMDKLVGLTGREYTWQKGLDQIAASPFLGWGFNSDRILLQSEHMHNSYLHAAIHTGIIGVLFFVAAIFGVWILVVRSRLLFRARDVEGPERAFLFEAILILGFLSARGFFESTGAFYGVDELLLVPAMAYVGLMARRELARPAAPEGEQP